MTDLRYTLVSDGSSDQALLPLLSWSLREQGLTSVLYPVWANLAMLPRRPDSLESKIRSALELYPCNLLFVHRDCETASVVQRQEEIRIALNRVFSDKDDPVPSVCVVPRRMTEAWLLISESVIRTASGNPNGRVPLLMPVHNRLEDLPDPKENLFFLLRQASELRGRRLRRLRVHQLVHRVIELIEDFSPLRTLPSFIAFEAQLRESLREIAPA